MIELKGKACCVGSNLVQNLFSTVLTQCQDSRMYFGYGFYTEAIVSISHMDGLPVEQADTDSKRSLLTFAEIRNIVGILAAGIMALRSYASCTTSFN